MKSADNIHKKIKKLKLCASADLDKKVHDDISKALAETNKVDSAHAKPNIWRIIMKSPMTKIAAAAVILIASLLILHLLGFNVESTTFAAVVEQLHNARTMTYSVVGPIIENVLPARTEVAFKEPGYMRATMPGGSIEVIDWVEGKGIRIIPLAKQFIEMEIVSTSADPSQQQLDIIEKLRTLPDRADVALGEKEINGRVLQGFRVKEIEMFHTIWIDPQTRELVRVEVEFADGASVGVKLVMTDFQFDIELPDSLFSLTPPEDYARTESKGEDIAEKDLISGLRMYSGWIKDGFFPPTIEPLELAKVAREMEKQGTLIKGQRTEQQRHRDAVAGARLGAFIVRLSSENDWHYAGENVKFGDTDTAVFWYRPDGSETYRVVYGDLSIKDVTSENLPK